MLKTLLSSAHFLNIKLKTEKMEGPTQKIITLGFFLDLVNKTITISSEKVRKYAHHIDIFVKMKICNIKDIQSILGKI